MTILNELLKDPGFAYRFKKGQYIINITEEFLDLYADYGWRGVLEGVKETIVALWHNRDRGKLIQHINSMKQYKP